MLRLRRRMLAVVVLVSPVVLIGFGPSWSSKWVEARRQSSLQSAAARVDLATLPVCPVGIALDALLNAAQSEARRDPRSDRWIPVCRRPELPAHRILIVSSARSEFKLCEEQIHYPDIVRPGNVTCVLSENLQTLANPVAAHTFARFEARNTVWISSRELAWQGDLEREHRAIAWLGVSALIAAWLAPFMARRWSAAVALQTAAGSPHRALEFLLYLAGAADAVSIAGDLREEYADIRTALGPKDAGRWYRIQVFTSLRGLARIQFRRWFG